ncbi:MAG TPA: flagellar type III secretion system pore protein FliP [Planctomycetaceae bacterium]|nr:flagellar type III secretion system pore protein FliP [Planctomycetaceae bacterium]
MTDRPQLPRLKSHGPRWRCLRLNRGKIAVAAVFASVVLAMIPRGTAAQQAQQPPIAQPGQRVIENARAGAAEGPLEGPKFQPAPQQSGLPVDVEQMLSPSGLSTTLKILLVLTVISLAPAILIMTTCFIRFVIVFSLLRQALGTQQLPPNQVLVSLSLFLTFLVMSPVWKEAYDQGIRPYSNPKAGEAPIGLEDAFHRTARPLRRFMIEQIQRTDNLEALVTFFEFQHPNEKATLPEDLEEVDTVILLPAFMLSELKTAFVIGFQIYLPFLVIDMVIATVLISMGMMMLPPVLISLPFKLLLFVLIDGWALTVGMLLESVRAATG